MAKIRTQADRRKHAVFTDQHGRKWFAVIEKDTMHPCSAITPHGGWHEAEGCTVPDVYKTFPDEQDPFRMVIDYATWIADWAEARKDYDGRAATTAAFMSPDDGGTRLITFNDDEEVVAMAPALRKYVGETPKPVELVRAMRAGNKWALGLLNPATGKPYPRPAWAEKFAPKKERTLANEREQFPDVEDEAIDDDFEDAASDEELEQIARDKVEFPDEPEDRLEDGGDLDDDDAFSHLNETLEPTDTPKGTKKPPATAPTGKRNRTATTKG